MTDRTELVEAALESYPEGIALFDLEDHVAFWNRAAEILTGYSAADVVGRSIPAALEPLTICRDYEMDATPANGPRLGRGSLVHAQHKSGRDIPAIARKVLLRGGLGQRIGAAAVFHPAENSTALPHGETSEGAEVQQSQAEMQDRMEVEFEAFIHEATPFGVLWVTVDQAQQLRKTHGARACEAMLESVERTLANGLRAGEEVGRWGDDEFLVLSQERIGEVLANHGQVLAGLARTAVFHWWGDRVSLTISVGAAEARQGETLPQLLERAQAAMMASIHVGGNHASLAPRG
jgi:diguanylate cyclase (GGDEF)-like protein/PAS domain S-box-containing protein